MAFKTYLLDDSNRRAPLEKVFLFDKDDDALTTIASVHHEIHEGHHFYVEGFVTLADTATMYAKLIVPNTDKRIHLRWLIDASGILETNFYEGASGGMTGGSSASVLNSNRNSNNKSCLAGNVTTGVTVATNKGTLVSSKKVGGTGFKTFFGGSSERDDEIILKNNTTYFREFISGSADNVVSFRASWYEH